MQILRKIDRRQIFSSKIWLGGHRPTGGTQISNSVTVDR